MMSCNVMHVCLHYYIQRMQPRIIFYWPEFFERHIIIIINTHVLMSDWSLGKNAWGYKLAYSTSVSCSAITMYPHYDWTNYINFVGAYKLWDQRFTCTIDVIEHVKIMKVQIPRLKDGGLSVPVNSATHILLDTTLASAWLKSSSTSWLKRVFP